MGIFDFFCQSKSVGSTFKSGTNTTVGIHVIILHTGFSSAITEAKHSALFVKEFLKKSSKVGGAFFAFSQLLLVHHKIRKCDAHL